MKVYVFSVSDGDVDNIRGVYSSWHKAQEAREKYKLTEMSKWMSLTAIDEFIVDYDDKRTV